jgi:hypothetical protein
MAIYRPRRSPWPLALGMAALALLLGFGIGYLVFGTRPPDLDEAADVVALRLAEARGLLEVAGIEYREGAPDGTIASEPEYAASGQALERATQAVDAVAGPLETLAPERAAALDEGFASIASLIEDVAPPDEVDAAIEAQLVLLGDPSAGD